MSERRAVLLHCSFKATVALRWPLGHGSRLAPSFRSHILLTAPEMTSRADTHPWLQCARHPVCHLLSKLSAITEKVRIGVRGRNTSKGLNVFFFGHTSNQIVFFGNDSENCWAFALDHQYLSLISYFRRCVGFFHSETSGLDMWQPPCSPELA